MFDGGPDRTRRGRRRFFLPEMWIHFIELPDLAIGSPAQIAVAGILQIHPGNLPEATRGIEAGSKFVGDRLLMNKAVAMGRADGLFVKAHRIDVSTLEAGKLGADQRGTVLEIVRAICRPDLELLVMRSDSLQVPLSQLDGCRGIAGGRLR